MSQVLWSLGKLRIRLGALSAALLMHNLDVPTQSYVSLLQGLMAQGLCLKSWWPCSAMHNPA